jgi:hypothetical protein
MILTSVDLPAPFSQQRVNFGREKIEIDSIVGRTIAVGFADADGAQDQLCATRIAQLKGILHGVGVRVVALQSPFRHRQIIVTAEDHPTKRADCKTSPSAAPRLPNELTHVRQIFLSRRVAGRATSWCSEFVTFAGIMVHLIRLAIK